MHHRAELGTTRATKQGYLLSPLTLGCEDPLQWTCIFAVVQELPNMIAPIVQDLLLVNSEK
ncbi:hypothetical protein T440DRAFT_468156 [Plenodomus tracheiphilus IPT5]|uniref:Uncharacterized protein n=1 Tax=Plenodomus tracheiphilus IPT5 TaxID=1408161 RepID=A0A6A7B6H9_9PLEO|nr:hypothetical protein T440DRAFT_468156 [Plenodomus tracheiphilus IPT5]